NLVVGCKSDPSPVEGVSNWDAIKSSCLLAGPRTLNGSLVALKGLPPVNNGFESSDHHSMLGLKGNSGKYLDSNFTPTVDRLDNIHGAVYRTEPEGITLPGTGIESLFGNTSSGRGFQITTTNSQRLYRANNSGNSLSDTTRYLG